MTIDELFATYSFGSGQQMLLRTAAAEDADGFAKLVQKTSSAATPPAALCAAVKRGEHRTTRKSPVAAQREPRVTTLAGGIAFAEHLYRVRITKYPIVDEPGWRQDDHIAYAAEIAEAASKGKIGSIDIEEGLRQRLAPRNCHATFHGKLTPAEVGEAGSKIQTLTGWFCNGEITREDFDELYRVQAILKEAYPRQTISGPTMELTWYEYRGLVESGELDCGEAYR